MLTLALGACVVAAAGCGAGNGSAPDSEPAHRSAVQTQENLPSQSAVAGRPTAQGGRSSQARAKGSSGRAADGEVATSKSGASSSAPASKGTAKLNHPGSGRGSGSAPHHPGSAKQHPHKPAKPAQPAGGAGSGSSPSASALPPGVSVYDAARQTCGNRQNLEALPPQRRNDAGFIIGLVAGFAPAGQEQEARDGCRSGLQSLGIG